MYFFIIYSYISHSEIGKPLYIWGLPVLYYGQKSRQTYYYLS